MAIPLPLHATETGISSGSVDQLARVLLALLIWSITASSKDEGSNVPKMSSWQNLHVTLTLFVLFCNIEHLQFSSTRLDPRLRVPFRYIVFYLSDQVLVWLTSSSGFRPPSLSFPLRVLEEDLPDYTFTRQPSICVR